MTQIVIPKAIYPSHLDQQNIFQPSISSEDLAANPIYSQKTSSKKPTGAFKFYKLKKLRKTQPESTHSQPPTSPQQAQLHKSYKLKTKFIGNLTEESITKLSSNSEPVFGYYDPNIAPLVTADYDMGIEVGGSALNNLQKNGIFPLENQQKIIVQKKQPKNIQMVEQQLENFPQFQYQEQQAQLDDPFIIIKKVEVKKAKLKKSLDSVMSMSKCGRKSKQNQLFQAKISKLTQLSELKLKELDTPSVKSRDEFILPETEKSQHSKMQEIVDEARQARIDGYKRYKCFINDQPDFSHCNFNSDHNLNLARNLFEGNPKSAKNKFTQ